MANEKRLELIDRNAIKYEKRTECFGHGEFFEVQKVYKEDIDKMPTVDAVEVVHGRWEREYDGGRFVCSNCRSVKVSKERLSYFIATGRWNYCPNCGAKMDGDGNA